MKKIVAIILIISIAALCAIPAYAHNENNPYDEVFESMTTEDYEALEQVVYWESARAGCPYTTDLAVIETVLNRVLDESWPDTVYKVCHDTRWGRQFVCKSFRTTDAVSEEIFDSICFVMEEGPTQLPSLEYQFFATKKQSLGKNHIWIGELDESGNPKKGKGMYFCELK